MRMSKFPNSEFRGFPGLYPKPISDLQTKFSSEKCTNQPCKPYTYHKKASLILKKRHWRPKKREFSDASSLNKLGPHRFAKPINKVFLILYKPKPLVRFDKHELRQGISFYFNR